MRRLLPSLPDNEFAAWTGILASVLKQGTPTAKEMESIIGQLGHIGMAVPFVHHFLSRLWDLQTRETSRRAIKLNKECRNGLLFMIEVIKITHSRISLNIIVHRHPTHIYCSDSCPAEMHGDITSHPTSNSDQQTIYWNTLPQSSLLGLISSEVD